jgi:hypothetical protein
MTEKQFFTVGLKWVGVYSLSLALEVFFDSSFPEFIRSANLAQTDAIFRVSQWFSLLQPLASVVAGLFLIKHRLSLEDALYFDDGNKHLDFKGFFEVVVKLYGTYLVVSSIPECIAIISNSIMVLYAPRYLSTSVESNAIRSQGVSVLATLAIGMWCIFKDKSLSRFAFG